MAIVDKNMKEKEIFAADLMNMMARASFDGDMMLPVDYRVTITLYKLFDSSEWPRLREIIDRELS